MAITDEQNPLSFAFRTDTPAGPLSYEALQTRRKIAEQLMGKRSPFPKTLGEGLTYAGERIADVMDMNRLDAEDRARQASLLQQAKEAGEPGAAPAISAVPRAEAPAPAPEPTVATAPEAVPAAPAPDTATRLAAVLTPRPAPVSLAGTNTPDVGVPANAFSDPMAGEAPKGNFGLQPLNNARRLAPIITNRNSGNMVIAGQIPSTSFGAGRAYGPLPDVAPSDGGSGGGGGGGGDDVTVAGLPPAAAPTVLGPAVPSPRDTIQAAPPEVRMAQTGAPGAEPSPTSVGRAATPAVEFLKELTPPAQTPIGDRERMAWQRMRAAPTDPGVQAIWGPVVAEEAAKRKFIDDRNVKTYDAKLDQWKTNYAAKQAAAQERPKTEAELRKQEIELGSLPEQRRQEAVKRELENEQNARADAFAKQMGNLPKEAVEAISNDYIKTKKPDVEVIAQAQTAIRNARAALSQGAITGFGAEARINWSRLMGLMGYGDQGSDAANSQLFKSVMQPVINAQRRAAAGGTNISDADIRNAEKAAGADFTLDPRTLHHMLNILEDNNLEALKDYDAKSRVLFGTDKNPAAQAAYGAPRYETEPQRLPAPPPGQRVQVWSEKDAQRYPKGTPIVLPSGRLGVVQ